MGLAACCAEGLSEERGFGEERGLAGDLTALIVEDCISGVMPAMYNMFRVAQRKFSKCQQQTVTADTLSIFDLTRQVKGTTIWHQLSQVVLWQVLLSKT